MHEYAGAKADVYAGVWGRSKYSADCYYADCYYLWSWLRVLLNCSEVAGAQQR